MHRKIFKYKIVLWIGNFSGIRRLFFIESSMDLISFYWGF